MRKRGEKREEEHSERRGSMCRSLGAGASLPRTETLEQRARPPISRLLWWQTELGKTSHQGFRTLAVSMSGTGSPRMSLGPSNVPDSSLGSPGNEFTATELDGAGCGLWGPGCASWERTPVTRPQPSACSGAPGQDPLQLSPPQTQGSWYPLQELGAQAPSEG